MCIRDSSKGSRIFHRLIPDTEVYIRQLSRIVLHTCLLYTSGEQEGDEKHELKLDFALPVTTEQKLSLIHI